MANANWTWNRIGEGYTRYEASDGRAVMVKEKAGWVLIARDGRRFQMSKKATFSHADAIVSRENLS